MHRFFQIFLSSLLLISSLYSTEPFLARLTSIQSNDIQTFQYGNLSFTCLTYGIISIDELYRKADDGSVCKRSIENFYKKRRDLKYFTHSKLKVHQLYSMDRKKNNRCMVNVLGEKTLSEMLIQEGLALKKPLFKDKEYYYYLYKSQEKARVNLKGIWKENITKDCVTYIYSPEHIQKL